MRDLAARPALSARPLTIARNEFDVAARPASRKAAIREYASASADRPILRLPQAASRALLPGRCPLDGPWCCRRQRSRGRCRHRRQLARSSEHTPRPTSAHTTAALSMLLSRSPRRAAFSGCGFRRAAANTLLRAARARDARDPGAPLAELVASRGPPLAPSRGGAREQHLLHTATTAQAQRITHTLPARRAARPRAVLGAPAAELHPPSRREARLLRLVGLSGASESVSLGQEKQNKNQKCRSARGQVLPRLPS